MGLQGSRSVGNTPVRVLARSEALDGLGDDL